MHGQKNIRLGNLLSFKSTVVGRNESTLLPTLLGKARLPTNQHSVSCTFLYVSNSKGSYYTNNIQQVRL